MSHPSKQKIARALLDRHGRTFARDVGINLSRPGPSALLRLLCAAHLFSARISADIAVEAARALAKQGWTTPQKMASSTWRQRTDTLNRAGYARYDESTSRMLGENVELLLDRYGGDLRRLREEAGRDADTERELLKQFKGIGDVGVDIFFREVQGAWDELYPFADRPAVESAEKLGLGRDARSLSQLVSKTDFPRLIAALVRVKINKDHEAIFEAA